MEVDYEIKMKSPEILSLPEEEKFGQIGQVLNSLQTHNNRTDRMLSDLSHQYSKYCLVMSGEALPKMEPREDCVGMWIAGMKAKYNINIEGDEKTQFKACHRMGDRNLHHYHPRISF